jgi:hypothetical protein
LAVGVNALTPTDEGLTMATIPITDAIRAAARDLLARDGERLSYHQKRSLEAVADPASGRKVIDVDWWRLLHGVHPQQAESKAKAKDRQRIEALKRLGDETRNPNPAEAAAARRKAAELEAKPTAPPQQRSAPGLEEHDRQQAARKEAIKEALKRANAIFDDIPDDPVERQAWFDRRREEWRAKERAKRAARKAAKAAERAGAPQPEPEPEPEPNAGASNTTPSDEAPRAEEKASPRPADGVNTAKVEEEPVKPKAQAEPVNTSKDTRKGDRHKPRSGDRHAPGYMQDYMRRWRKKQR